MNDSPSNTTILPMRIKLDLMVNAHGRQLVDFLRDTDMVVLNG